MRGRAEQVHREVDVGEHPLPGVLPHSHAVGGVDQAQQPRHVRGLLAADEVQIGADPDAPPAGLAAVDGPEVQRSDEAAAPDPLVAAGRDLVVMRHTGVEAPRDLGGVLPDQPPGGGPHHGLAPGIQGRLDELDGPPRTHRLAPDLDLGGGDHAEDVVCDARQLHVLARGVPFDGVREQAGHGSHVLLPGVPGALGVQRGLVPPVAEGEVVGGGGGVEK